MVEGEGVKADEDMHLQNHLVYIFAGKQIRVAEKFESTYLRADAPPRLGLR